MRSPRLPACAIAQLTKARPPCSWNGWRRCAAIGVRIRLPISEATDGSPWHDRHAAVDPRRGQDVAQVKCLRIARRFHSTIVDMIRRAFVSGFE